MNQIIKISLLVLLVFVSFSEQQLCKNVQCSNNKICQKRRCCVSEHNSCTSDRSCCDGMYCDKLHMRDAYGTCQYNYLG